MARKIIGSGGWLSAGLFAVALGVRLLNAPYVFEEGKPRITPVDELYHWKRIAYSAAHFPNVLDLDRDRGVGGAFCPWPPLYDVASGGVARLLGAGTGTDKSVCATLALPATNNISGRGRDQCGTDTLVCADKVLERIVWFPPILFALFVGITVFILSRRTSIVVATITGTALATSPFLVTTSWIGSIDHHFLEPVLTFAILGAACLGICADTRRQRIRAGILLGIAVTAAMFVQTALLIAAALAFAVLFLWGDGVAATCGFGIAAVAVALYRLTRAPGFPDNQWFLGWTHASLFAAAAAASAIVVVRPRWRAAALLAGVAVVLASPTVPASLLSGAHFFGGDRWLKTIQEFQPLWRAHGDDLLSALAGFSGGAILVWFLLVRAIRTRDHARLAVALFAIAYLGLTITSRRFWIVAIPLLALAGALYIPLIARNRLAILAALMIALPPPLQLAGWLMTPITPVPANQQQWLNAVSFIRTLPPGRVLGPWSMGHAIDVEGHHPVVIDNFGTMPDANTFERAQEAFLAHDETALARYCDAAAVRYLILEQPRFGIASANAILGTERAQESTWWWHVWRGEQPRMFRMIWSDPQLRIYQR
jgi:asparagine N-glycosylation enzyme membrane subunit Stt3